ncbi:MAG: ATP-binding cassette domain-containing protein [Pseudomonadota bacterium]
MVPALTIAIDGLRRGDARVLGPIALRVSRGETVALVGPSGVGKTSLLRAVAGLTEDFDGRIDRPARLTFVFQEPTLLPWRTVLANVTLPTGATEDRALATLAGVGLAGREADYPAQLSLGQQRRLSLARAFAAQPDLLLLDEPFVSLDEALAREMMDLVAAFREGSGAAVLLVTHARAEADRLADRIVTLGGQPATVTGTETLRRPMLRVAATRDG